MRATARGETGRRVWWTPTRWPLALAALAWTLPTYCLAATPRGAKAAAAALAEAATPTQATWPDVEAALLASGHPRGLASRAAATQRALAQLSAARDRQPHAAGVAARSHEIAEMTQEWALLTWHVARAKCEAAPPRQPAKAAAAAAPPTCPPRLALEPAIQAWLQVLAGQPQHRREVEIRALVAVLSLRQARADNDLSRALQSRETLARELKLLPPSRAQAEATHWLAEDDADQGRADLAVPVWRLLASQRQADAMGAYARYRGGWWTWFAGDPTAAQATLAAVAGGASALAAWARRDAAWMAARLAARARSDAPPASSPAAAAARGQAAKGSAQRGATADPPADPARESAAPQATPGGDSGDKDAGKAQAPAAPHWPRQAVPAEAAKPRGTRASRKPR